MVKDAFPSTRMPDLKTTTPITEVEECAIRQRSLLLHTRELGLRIAWNFWGNDKYTDRFLVLREFCGNVVKIVGDQHGAKIMGENLI
jgi:hypothetical protein